MSSRLKNEKMKDQRIIILGMLALMMTALIIDGEFGERMFGMLVAGFGLILGYFFRKSGEEKKKCSSLPQIVHL